MLTPYLQLLQIKPHLTKEEAEAAMSIILQEAQPHQTAAFLAILKYRGETAEEVAGMVKALEKKALPVGLSFPVLDIVGTGGDLANTVNISTGSAILAAACGIPIAKHGNRSVSSQSGSADVLEALGIEIEVFPKDLEKCLQEANIAFMFAPTYHPSLKKISAIRRGLKLPTVFNILGPLLNPAKAEYALIGVADASNLELISKILLNLGRIKRALVFHGSGLDELTTLGPIIAYEIHHTQMTRLEIDPLALGFSPCSLKDLQGGNAQKNASILKEIFSCKKGGAIADALIFNAGAALYIFNKASSLNKGVQIARKALQGKKAVHVLQKWKNFSKKLREKRQSANYLDQILLEKKKEVEQLISITHANPKHPLNKILNQQHILKKSFSNSLKSQKFAVIGEIKRASPTRGKIQDIPDPISLAIKYCQGGASAISILTDSKSFGGTLKDLSQVSKELAIHYPSVPTLRKDFIIHPLQLAEAVLAKTSAVLLIVRILGKEVKILLEEATRLGLEAVIEVHDLNELEIALAAGASIIGINHRNLTTFEIDLTLSEHLRPLIPSHVITIAESGIHTSEQAKHMQDLGYDAILVGEALVRLENPSSLIQCMKEGKDED
jgi:anthranilate phosphoribosyltransferase